MPAVGARIGYDVTAGGAFYFHPVDAVLNGTCTNPNVVVFGEPGTGKSSTVVAAMLRMMPFGVKTLISGDVKGEYTPVLKALGATPIVLGPGSPARVNALDLGPLTARWDTWTARRQRSELTWILGRWVQLLTALAEAQGYAATVTDEAVLAAVLRRAVGAADANTRLRPITIPDVHRALADPPDELWRESRFADRRQFLDHLRPITDALNNLVSGPLAGMFDAATNVELDWDAPAQSMDLSRLDSRGDKAVAVALTCLGSWSAIATDLQDDGEIRIVVRDEVWRQMRLGVRALMSFDSELRLSRKHKIIQIALVHKPADFLTVGDAGSQAASIARDMLSLFSTRVLFGQTTRVATELGDALSLAEKERLAISGWANHRRGRALWKTENQTGRKVQTVLSAVERRHFDTNIQLRSTYRNSRRETSRNSGAADVASGSIGARDNQSVET
ncbi:ATP-binding protein [Amycolatopsis alba DSM 44262]|uniref:ATP-binding protein n=2 Tax=Amycolatopsis alba TaxID=76020 RepID=A0A229RA33_AMYAL|nr:ATP-binding protein [Amycolatopsis alba DSM 44262]